MKHLIQAFTLAALTTTSGALLQEAKAAPLSIADIAPPDSHLVVGVDSWTKLTQAYQNSPVKALVDEPQMKEWLDELWSDLVEQTGDTLKNVGAEWKDIGLPSGMAGAAVWFTFDDEDGGFSVHALLAVDFGEQAERAESIVVDLLDRAHEEGDLDLRQIEIAGHTAHSFKLSAIDDEDPESSPLFDPAAMTFMFSRVGGVLLAATDEDSLADAIDRIEGADNESLAGDNDFSDAMAQLGPANAYAVAMPHSIAEQGDTLLKELARDQGAGEAPLDLLATLSALGLDEVRAMTTGLRLDSDAGQIEVNYSVLADNKNGLLALFDVSEGKFPSPSFADPDAASITAIRFDFQGLLPLLATVIQSLPEASRGQFQAIFGMISAAAAPALQTLGPEVFFIQSVHQPLSASSMQALTAIRTTDATAVSNMLTQLGAMVGLSSRDFEGAQIWETPKGAGPQLAIGLGFGYVFIGAADSIQSAMRQAGDADAPNLANEERFKRALALLDEPVVAYQYSDTKSLLTYSQWQMKHMPEILRARIEEAMGDADPETRQQILDQQLAIIEANPLTKITLPFDAIVQHFGDSISQVQSTEDGFVGRFIWLAPAD